jgi:hypothetical protein
MSPCICAGACLCGAVLGYVLHTYCQQTEIAFAEINFKEVEAIRDKTNESIV